VSEYLTIGILSAILVLIISWMFATARHHYIIRCVTAVIVLGLVIANWLLIADIIAWPINDYPPDKTYLISSIPSSQKHINYLWIVDPHQLDRGPRSYIVPFVEEEVKQQKEAFKQARKEDAIVIYHRPKRLKGKSGTGDGDDDSDDGSGGSGKSKGKGKGKSGQDEKNGGTQFRNDEGNGGTATVQSQLPSKDDLNETTRRN